MFVIQSVNHLLSINHHVSWADNLGKLKAIRYGSKLEAGLRCGLPPLGCQSQVLVATWSCTRPLSRRICRPRTSRLRSRRGSVLSRYRGQPVLPGETLVDVCGSTPRNFTKHNLYLDAVSERVSGWSATVPVLSAVLQEGLSVCGVSARVDSLSWQSVFSRLTAHCAQSLAAHLLAQLQH